MKTKRLGNSDMFISSLGFGSWATMTIPSRALERALELGVNWIDTAAVYGMGHSEEVIARTLANWPGPRPYVFTKCGLQPDDKGQLRRVLTAASIRSECEQSLRRLGVEIIDLYQIHWPVEDPQEIEEGWITMSELRREGKVRWIGVSNFNVDQLKRLQTIAPVTSLQPRYSIVHPEAEREILPFCHRENIGVIVYSPMASGLLTGAMTREGIAKLPENNWRKHDPDFNEPRLSTNLALVERLRAIGKRHAATPGAVAVAWTLRNSTVTGAIVGVREPEQVEDLRQVEVIRLTADEFQYLETAGVPQLSAC